MAKYVQLLTTSIGKKAIMALTGLGLLVFLIVHLVGNLLLFVGDDAFNHYAQKYEDNAGIVYVIEAGLLLVFVVHIGLALRTAMENREARGKRYAIRRTTGRQTPGSASMIVTGVIIGVFLVIHLLDFRLHPDKSAEHMAQMVRDRLTQPVGIAIYLVGVLAVGLHLSHAIRSAFQTLGLSHPRYDPAIQMGGLGLSLVLCLGFAAFPVLLGPPADPEVGAVQPAAVTSDSPIDSPAPAPALDGDQGGSLR